MHFFQQFRDLLLKIVSEEELDEIKKAHDDPPANPWILDKLKELKEAAANLNPPPSNLAEFNTVIEDEIVDMEMFLSSSRCDPVTGSAKKHM